MADDAEGLAVELSGAQGVESGITVRWIDLPRPVAWQYVSLPRDGLCRIDGRLLSVELTLSSDRTRRVPDVLYVEAWLVAALTTPTTVEELAIGANVSFGLRASCRGSTATHGDLTVEVE